MELKHFFAIVLLVGASQLCAGLAVSQEQHVFESQGTFDSIRKA